MIVVVVGKRQRVWCVVTVHVSNSVQHPLSVSSNPTLECANGIPNTLPSAPEAKPAGCIFPNTLENRYRDDKILEFGARSVMAYRTRGYD